MALQTLNEGHDPLICTMTSVAVTELMEHVIGLFTLLLIEKQSGAETSSTKRECGTPTSTMKSFGVITVIKKLTRIDI